METKDCVLTRGKRKNKNKRKRARQAYGHSLSASRKQMAFEYAHPAPQILLSRHPSTVRIDAQSGLHDAPRASASALKAPARIISGLGAGGANPTIAIPGFQ